MANTESFPLRSTGRPNSRVTVQDCIDFYAAHWDPCTLNYGMKRLHAHLSRLLGDKMVRQLKRKEIWDALAGLPWPTCRDCLERLKSILNYAAKPRTPWHHHQATVAPAPIIAKWDNPLEGVVVNLKSKTASTKADQPSPELIHDMTIESEAAYSRSQKLRERESGNLHLHRPRSC